MPADILETFMRVGGLGAYTSAFKQIASHIDAADAAAERLVMRNAALAAGGAVLTYTLFSGLRKSVLEAGEFEARVITLARLFQMSEGAARGFLDQLRDLAISQAMPFDQMSRYVGQLHAMGFSVQELMPLMRVLGDTAAAVGTDKMYRIILALGHIKTQGSIVKREVNMLARDNIPIYDILREKLHLTAEQVKNIGKMGISSAKALPAILSWLTEHFGGLAEARANTIPGRIQQMTTLWQKFLVEIGEPMVPGVTAGLTMVVRLVRWLTDHPIAAQVSGIALAVGTLGAGLFTLSQVLKLTAGIQALAGIGGAAGAGGGIMASLAGAGSFLAGIAPILAAVAAGGFIAAAAGSHDRAARATFGGLGGGLAGGVLGLGLAALMPEIALPLVAGLAALGGVAGGLGFGLTRGPEASDPGLNIQQQQAATLESIDQTLKQQLEEGQRISLKVLAGGDDIKREYPEADLAYQLAGGF